MCEAFHKTILYTCILNQQDYYYIDIPMTEGRGALFKKISDSLSFLAFVTTQLTWNNFGRKSFQYRIVAVVISSFFNRSS